MKIGNKRSKLSAGTIERQTHKSLPYNEPVAVPEVVPVVEPKNLGDLSYRDLQARAKALGTKATQTRDVLEKEILAKG